MTRVRRLAAAREVMTRIVATGPAEVVLKISGVGPGRGLTDDLIPGKGPFRCRLPKSAWYGCPTT
jgi:hypothetical protein